MLRRFIQLDNIYGFLYHEEHNKVWPCLHLMNWSILNGGWGQTHCTVSAPFSGSHSRSALFNIFRAVGFYWERRRRENHCCYGDEERVSGGWGALWQKTRPDPTMALSWMLMCFDNTTFSKPTFNQRLVPETLYSHYVWQPSVAVTPTECSKHLHI